MPSYFVKRCHHIKMNCTQCGSPAMRTERFCFFHLSYSPQNVDVKPPDNSEPDNFLLPVLEDATSIQLAITQVTTLLLRERIDVKKARVLICAMRLASSNLKRMDTEKPGPTQMLIDIRSIPKTPIGAALWDAATEGPDPEIKPPQTPAARSGDAHSQNRKKPAPSQRGPLTPTPDLIARLKDALKKDGEKWAEEEKKRIEQQRRPIEENTTPKRAESNDGLPPGTIQARQSPRPAEIPSHKLRWSPTRAQRTHKNGTPPGQLQIPPSGPNGTGASVCREQRTEN